MPPHHLSRSKETDSHSYIWKWLWACCNCGMHAAMTTLIDHCPGCQRMRCEHCPMELTKMRTSGPSGLLNPGSLVEIPAEKPRLTRVNGPPRSQNFTDNVSSYDRYMMTHINNVLSKLIRKWLQLSRFPHGTQQIQRLNIHDGKCSPRGTVSATKVVLVSSILIT